MPMGMTHNYKFAANIGVLKSYIAQRTQACEQADTVAVAICIWNEVWDRFPLIASHLRPGCDFAKKCTYHQASTLSEMFSALFAGCGRWPDPVPYATFNKSCSSYKEIIEQLNEGGESRRLVHFPEPSAWPMVESFDDCPSSDKELLSEGYEG